MIELSGIPASPGVAVARAFLFAPEDSSAVPARAVAAAEIDAEWGASSPPSRSPRSR